MRRTLLAAVLMAFTCLPAAVAGDEPDAELLARVTREITESDPLAAGSSSALLDADDAMRGVLFRIGRETSEPEIARDRALRLEIALNRVDRVREETHRETRSVRWWLSLDELDREIAPGPRERLLARALPDEGQRAEALRALAAGRDVATRFCRDWNELERNEEETALYAALRKELKEAGSSAIPYLATLLAVPPQAVFTDLHGVYGPTARQQVRALFALDILDARSCLCLLVFHARGPSFTQSTTALAALRRMAKLEFPEGADEAAQLAVVDAWWSAPESWSQSTRRGWETDHLLRHTLRWARNALASEDPVLVEWSEWGPRQLERVFGRLDFDADASAAERAAQLAALEREAMRRCPVCIR